MKPGSLHKLVQLFDRVTVVVVTDNMRGSTRPRQSGSTDRWMRGAAEGLPAMSAGVVAPAHWWAAGRPVLPDGRRQ
jgi:hypothetical protein